MAIGQKPDQQPLDQIILADNDFFDLGADGCGELAVLFNFFGYFLNIGLH